MDDRRLRKPAGFVVAGVVVKAHGLRGEVKVRPFTQTPDSLTRYRQLYLGGEEAATLTPHTCELGRVSGIAVILRLAGCTDRDGAERLVGQQVWLSVADLPPAGDANSQAVILAAALDARDGEDQVAIRQGRRFAARIGHAEPPPAPKPVVRKGATYLVTGGFGGKATGSTANPAAPSPGTDPSDGTGGQGGIGGFGGN